MRRGAERQEVTRVRSRYATGPTFDTKFTEIPFSAILTAESKAEPKALEIFDRLENEIQANSRIDRSSSSLVQWTYRILDEFSRFEVELMRLKTHLRTARIVAIKQSLLMITASERRCIAK